MFAVKILTIIVLLQVVNNTYSFPHEALVNLGTFFGWTNGLLSQIAQQTRTTTGENTEGETDSTPLIDLLGTDDMKQDDPETPRANCSLNCARKTFRELIFHK